MKIKHTNIRLDNTTNIYFFNTHDNKPSASEKKSLYEHTHVTQNDSMVCACARKHVNLSNLAFLIIFWKSTGGININKSLATFVKDLRHKNLMYFVKFSVFIIFMGSPNFGMLTKFACELWRYEIWWTQIQIFWCQSILF